MRSLRVPIPGGQISVRVAGPDDASETVVLVHGGPGLASTYMVGLERLAQDGRRVVSYDQRGVGESTFESDDPADYDLARHDSDLSAVLDAIGAERVHLLGHSWGGVLAMQHAGTQPDRLASLLLIDSCPPHHTDLDRGYPNLGIRVAELTEQGVIPRELPSDPTARVRAMTPAYFADPTTPVAPEALEGLVLYPKASEMSAMALEGLDLTDGVARFTGPVLVLFGEADPFGVEWATATHSAFSRTQPELVLLPDCGHLGWIECPDLFFPAVESFLVAAAREGGPA